MHDIIAMRGEIALSPFRMGVLQESIKRLGLGECQNIESRYWYLLQHTQTLSKKKREHLCTLLNASFHHDLALLSDAQEVAVFPRFATISPWSSKAQDILHHAGLTEIKRVERGIVYRFEPYPSVAIETYIPLIHDRMTESVIVQNELFTQLFQHTLAQPLQMIDLLKHGKESLWQANKQFGLALSSDEVDYLWQHYRKLNRNPTDVELMMFAQANSEHCRHKIFNAQFVINDKVQDLSLFNMIKATHQAQPMGTIVAYKDNAAIIEGKKIKRWHAQTKNKIYDFSEELTHVLIKVETHNHPTAIAPFSGAATGSGGEIRDEGATGRGGKPKAGLCGFSVSNLRIPAHIEPWEQEDYGKPEMMSSALQIMLDGPIGNASFNNEFGRPGLLGYFRTLETDFAGQRWGYHKPIMLAGGLGSIQAKQSKKQVVPNESLLIQLGGPGFLIGLGGGAASSMFAGNNQIELDFNSVQRENPELERRCQEVIDSCCQLGEDNPILMIHDVGAGGLSNAFPELIHDAGKGGVFQLRDIPIANTQMSPKEIWCNESQERYVLVINPKNLARFTAICERERCPFAVVGKITQQEILVVEDGLFKNRPVDLPLSLLFGKMSRNQRADQLITATTDIQEATFLASIELREALYRVLRLPAVAAKDFLITIADRTVGGLTYRDQMVGPYQVPVADCAITAMSFESYYGEVMSIGERSILAIRSGTHSVRMAVGEALSNLMACYIGDLKKIKLSANWMAACGEPGEDAKLYQAVAATSKLCLKLGLAIPVGKDSLSMKALWQEQGVSKSVISPLSLIVSAFAISEDIRLSVSPQLQDERDSFLLLVDFSAFQARIACSALAQVFDHWQEGETPDFDYPEQAKEIFNLLQEELKNKNILALHDRSDGGLITTVLEMQFASRLGVLLSLDELQDTLSDIPEQEALLRLLFNEELGVVVQMRTLKAQALLETFASRGLSNFIRIIGRLQTEESLSIRWHGTTVLEETRVDLQLAWQQLSYHLQSLRDHPNCAKEERESIYHEQKKLISYLPDDSQAISVPFVSQALKPKVAILREEGINGHLEMAFAFFKAGFEAHDVHLSDLITGRTHLDQFQVLAACGGFSYGDVLGAGRGWASTILYNKILEEQFRQFFEKSDTLSLGVCNGCQMLSELDILIPGSLFWPRFRTNQSEQYEARLLMVKVPTSSSLWLQGLQGAILPVVVSHGEGQVIFLQENFKKNGHHDFFIALQYCNHDGTVANSYPMNPNGSLHGIAGVHSADGRVLIMMPHPERVVRNAQLSWCPPQWQGEFSPWLQLFLSARKQFL